MGRSWLLMLGMGLWASGLFGQLSKAETKQMLRMLQAAPTFSAVIDSLGQHDYHPDAASLEVAREALWQRLLEDQNRFPARKKAFEAGKCTYGNGKMGEFSLHVKGERPVNGYPLYIGLHGGGGGPKEMNDEQWEQMQGYYLGSIDTGLYVAPRGPNNTWNLHFDGDAEVFYAQLLQDLRVFAGADPNRIYLLGYSAGGDGVYQLAPRMASQLAAANMSAGHHNGVRADNLQWLPMLLQVGELDGAYDRNIETVRYALILDSLAKRFPGQFLHQVYVHARAEHSYVRDRMGARYQARVLADPRAWLLARKDSVATKAVTDGPTWLRQFRRNPYPLELRWDLGTRLDGNQDWYWISADLGGVAVKEGARNFIRIRVVPGVNRIEIDEFHGKLTLHLHEQLANPALPLVIAAGGQEFKVSLKTSVLEMAKSLAVHHDPHYSSWQAIMVSSDAMGKVVVR